MQRFLISSALLAAVVVAGATTASAQDTGAMSDQQYIAAVLGRCSRRGRAARHHRADDSERPESKTLQTGTNGFTCMMPQPGAPMCADKPAMVWGNAYMTPRRAAERRWVRLHARRRRGREQLESVRYGAVGEQSLGQVGTARDDRRGPASCRWATRPRRPPIRRSLTSCGPVRPMRI